MAAKVTKMTSALATHDTSTVRRDAGRLPPDRGDDGFIGGIRPVTRVAHNDLLRVDVTGIKIESLYTFKMD